MVAVLFNGPKEVLWEFIKSEMYYISNFRYEEELCQAIEKFIDYYNTGSYQERVNNLTPIEVRNAALQTDQHMQYPILENRRIQSYNEELEAK